uniref:SGNH hydrolase-type esterase domain-containing protein n=1 Tax=Alexandrium andersonii TaxID=327968 RepID=A0A7S2FRM8_9DINO
MMVSTMLRHATPRAFVLALSWLGSAGVSLRRGKPGRPIKVACVGASITQGFLSTPGHDYPAQVQRLLGDDYEVRNFGKSGRTALKDGKDWASFVKVDASYWQTKQYQDALAYMPDIVVLQFGANDSKDLNWKLHSQDMIPDYSALIQTFKKLASHPTVFVMAAPPVYNDGIYHMNATVVNDVLPDVFVRLSELNDLPKVVDVFGTFKKHCPSLSPNTCDWMSFDGAHPNDKGYRTMAEVVAAAISKTSSVDSA